jgi:hypothetical protein
MDAIRVAVVNWTHLDDTDVRSGVDALQEQLHEDFAPVWKVDADLEPIPSEVGHVWTGYWGLVLLDRRLGHEGSLRGDAPNHYGHRTSDGHPLARVFIDTVGTGQDWTRLASHELLEMLVDPDGNGTVVRVSSVPPSHLYAKRVCDPCAADSDGYQRRGRQVSDFVHPAWFGSALSGFTGTFDQRDLVSGPFTALAGGSLHVVDVATPPWLEPIDADLGPVPVPIKGAWPP